MNLLLDTHVVLWYFDENPRLPVRVLETIKTAAFAYVSAASAWEATIKAGKGRLTIPESFEAAIDESRLDKLPVEFRHVHAVRDLPDHHKDPFDRLLIAQSFVVGLTLVTADRHFAAYHLAMIPV
jgi:PIN domain nuclease of toxin-antitoxin system